MCTPCMSPLSISLYSVVRPMPSKLAGSGMRRSNVWGRVEPSSLCRAGGCAGIRRSEERVARVDAMQRLRAHPKVFVLGGSEVFTSALGSPAARPNHHASDMAEHAAFTEWKQHHGSHANLVSRPVGGTHDRSSRQTTQHCNEPRSRGMRQEHDNRDIDEVVLVGA